MNSIATTQIVVPPALSRKTSWLIALSAPIFVAPVWCLTMGDLPAGLGTANGVVLLLLLAACSVTDLSGRKIYNWATYSAIMWSVFLNLAARAMPADTIGQLGAIGMQSSLYGMVGCFTLMLFAYSLARGGAGDVKLAAAIGALVGLEQGVLAIGVSYIVAGVAVLAWSIWRQGPMTLLAALGRFLGSMLFPFWIERPTERDKVLLSTPVPLAGFFAIGTLVVVLGIV